jgi:glycosyltransferase involved in cell wall biosynthesis
MTKLVNIVMSDRGWIVEKLAKEIADRCSYVSASTSASEKAIVNYYMTYSSRRDRMPGIEMAFFTHMEKNANAAAKFRQVAKEVDYCVCMSEIYADMMRADGVAHVTTIKPGVDLELYRPRLRIGIVGRTYHTGRKGEALVASLMDIPDIEWLFTGEGWPGPALQLAAEELPAFYRSLDYVLVPALYEGGPMCVLEALACGTKVIAPPIGFVPDYPHIEFPAGDADALRKILIELVAEKFRVRESVLSETWDLWASEHDKLFRSLLPAGKLAASIIGTADDEPLQQSISALLLMHGLERESAGGPSLRVPKTAEELRVIGIDAQAAYFPTPEISGRSIVHGFNTWTASLALALCQQAKRLKKRLVFSPIFLDLSGRELWGKLLPNLFAAMPHGADLDHAIERLCATYELDSLDRTAPREPELGYHALVREIVALTDHTIFLSEHERALMARIGAVPEAGSVVRNPVDAERFVEADPSLFGKAFGIQDYVLCIGRLESRKNQLVLLQALRNTKIPIVLIGHVVDQSYEKLLRSITGANVHFLGRLTHGSGLLASAIAGARVFTLPSWAEGAPLAALEAGATGVPLVLSDRSGEAEYFGDLARYIYPGDPCGLRAAILEAYEADQGPERRAALREHVATHFSWERYTRETAQIYLSLQEQATRPRPSATRSRKRRGKNA